MPKNKSLFGKYLSLSGKRLIDGFKKHQIQKPIPPKLFGRVPSAASQTGLYHDEDYNYHTKVSFSLKKVRRKLKPNVLKKDFPSDGLNCTVTNLRVTTSALHAMDDVGGFDEYIRKCPPEELRSTIGEKMRGLMYFYDKNPKIREWGLPWRSLIRTQDQNDPYFAYFNHYIRKERYLKCLQRTEGRFSPYYLPKQAALHLERQQFADNAPTCIPITSWWKSKQEFVAFKRRLDEATPFDRRFADSRQADGYRKGNNKGGGGQPSRETRKRSKTFKYNELRPY